MTQGIGKPNTNKIAATLLSAGAGDNEEKAWPYPNNEQLSIPYMMALFQTVLISSIFLFSHMSYDLVFRHWH